jgi:hypothetical protein
MANVKTSGPKLRQIVIYNDATYGNIAAMITAVSQTTGLISLTTFPPGVSPQAQSNVSQDYTGATVGSWRYEEVDYA